MSENKLSFPKIFLLKAEFPVNLLMTRNAVFSATHIADLLSFNQKDKYDLEVAVEEAFSNAIQHFSKESVADERIYLEFNIEDGFLIVSIRENGIPFKMENSERFTPDNPLNMDKPGLGTFLIEQTMDSVEYFVHGRSGKETRMKKKFQNSCIPEGLVPKTVIKRGRKRPLVKNPIIREATLKDLPEICQLAWKCYGYTQEELLYDLDLLTKKFNAGEVKPIIAIDPESGKLIAHEALKYHDTNVRVSELSLAFIDPTYRCPDLSRKFAKKVLEVAKTNNERGIFDCSVTTHTFSQKASQEYVGSNPCSIFIGIAATGMQAKELRTTVQEKGTVVNHYYVFDHSTHRIYIPKQHQQMVEKIYSWLELTREFAPAKLVKPTGESSTICVPLPDELNVSFIVLNRLGENTVSEVRDTLHKCRSERQDMVYIFMPSGVETAPWVFNECEKLGFSFAGIMPHIHDGDDRLLLQWMNISIDYSKIKVYGPKSAELLEYVIKEIDRVNSI